MDTHVDTQTQAAPEPLFGNIPLDHVFESQTNPRTRFDPAALQELADSIQAHGVAQPILVRPFPGRDEDYEIVFGARRYRGSKIAGTETIPAIVRVLDDEQVAVMQNIENLQREDVHPIEEAEGYERMMKDFGYTVDQLAEKLGKSRAYIYARLKLCALVAPVRDAFFCGSLNASTALLIARIPVPDLQIKATGEITADTGYGSASGPMSYRKALDHIRARYMLDLNEAPFDIQDTKLVKAAGSCSHCPKRTGSNPELFSDVTSADVCTDPDCFGIKKCAHTKKILASAEKRGVPVFEQNAAHQIARQNGYSFFDRLNDFSRIGQKVTNAYRQVTDVLTEDQLPPPVAYAKWNDDTVVAMFDKTAMQLALEKAGICMTEEAFAEQEKADRESDDDPPAATTKVLTDAEKKQIERVHNAKLESEFHDMLYRKILDYSASGFSTGIYRELLKFLVHDYCELSIGRLSEAMIAQFPTLDADTDEGMLSRLDSASVEECECILLDTIIAPSLDVNPYDLDGLEESPTRITLLAMAAIAKVDVDQLRAAIFAPPVEVEARLAPAAGKKSRKKGKAIAEATDTNSTTAIPGMAAWPFPLAHAEIAATKAVGDAAQTEPVQTEVQS